jgi:hypothetical protein
MSLDAMARKCRTGSLSENGPDISEDFAKKTEKSFLPSEIDIDIGVHFPHCVYLHYGQIFVRYQMSFRCHEMTAHSRS